MLLTRYITRTQLAIRVSLALSLTLLLLVASPVARIKAQQDPWPPASAEQGVATTRYVSPGANCGGQSPCYATPQAAVDAAADGDTIKVGAGTYTTIGFEVIRVYSKSLELLAGYSPANWSVADPAANKAILDPQRVRGVRGIVVQGSPGNPITVTLNGFTVINGVNSPPQACGGICTLYAKVDIRNNYLYSNTSSSIQVAATIGVIDNNVVENTLTDSFTNSNVGIAIESAIMTLSNNAVRHNSLGIRVFATDEGNPSAGAYLYNNLVEDNTAGIVAEHANLLEARNNVVRKNVRGIRVRDQVIPFSHHTDVTITNNIVQDNSRVGLEISVPTTGEVVANTFTNNGDGITCGIDNGSTLFITANTFTGNGLGIECNVGGKSTVVMQSNLIDKNGSGGIHSSAGADTTVSIISNTVTNNGASGIAVDGGTNGLMIINGNWIENNKPEGSNDTDSGGGLYIGGDIQALVAHNRIARNATNRYGGGIFISGSKNRVAPIVVMSANLILTNTAQETGSGFAMSGGIVTATNDIIARNYQERPAVYIFRDGTFTGTLNANHWTIGNNGSNGIRALFGGRVKITNSIVAGHKIAALAESAGGFLEADNILSFDNAQGVCDVAATCTNIFEGDPKFLSDKLLNFHIKAGSAAIDRAPVSLVTEDIDGPGRPTGPLSDVGADEYGNAVITLYDVFLPLVLKQDAP